MTQTLTGRTAVMAGVTDMESEPLVKSLVSGGMNVVMLTHQMDKARLFIERLGKQPGTCIALAARVNDAREICDAYAKVAKRFGSIDVVVPRHGKHSGASTFEALEDEELIRDFSNRVAGSFDMMRYALPYLRKSRAPRVIFRSLSWDDEKKGCGIELAISFGAVETLTRIAASELGQEGICVNCIVEGPVPHDAPKTFVRESIASTVCWLASEESNEVNGQKFYAPNM